MTFENCIDKFPIWKTIIGNYGMDETFTISSKEGIDDIEHWHNSPLEWENDSDYDCAYPFVVYVGEGKFECWYFAGQRVNGYLNETDDPEKFFPATYSDDFGWEPYDPNNRDNYNALFFIPDMGLKDELIEAGRIKKIFGHKWMNEQIAYMYDSEKYMNGEIVTTFEQIKKFVHEKL